MNEGKVYWHIAKGDGSRDTSEIFIRYGVAALGPGDYGDFRLNPEIYAHRSDRFVRNIAKEVLPEHRIVIQSAAREILAVGIVSPSDDNIHTSAVEVSPAYTFRQAFGDLDGMDWQHIVRVKWRKIRHTFSSDICGPRFNRLGRIANEEVKAFVEEHLPETDVTLPELPPEPDPQSLDELMVELFDSGLSNASVENTLEAIRRIRRLLSWYRKAGFPKEHETVSHMVIPLLLGLGWSEQQLSVEWQNIDVAAFGTAPSPMLVRRAANCRMIVEVKRVGEGLWWAERQAHAYLKSLGSASICDCVVVTDGIRYNVFIPSQSNSFYINLDIDKLFEKTIDRKKSVDALRWMQPRQTPGAS